MSSRSTPAISTANPLNSMALIIQDEVKGLPVLRKHLSGYNQRTFSSDLSLVANCIRTGYLVDLFAPKDPVDLFSQLLSALRSDRRTKEIFAPVVHVFEPSSEQSFFVNARLLASRIKALVSGSSTYSTNPRGSPVFLHLQSPIKPLEEPPNRLLQVLKSLLPLTATPDPLPLSFSLPDDITIETAVPLAAVLLDYPIAYVPSPSYNNVLSGLPLDFYECVLISRGGDQSIGGKAENQDDSRTIMKFSCPTEMASEEDSNRLQPERMMAELKEMFMERLRLIGDTTMEVTIVHSTQTLDHVTF
ncbi:hypothetical protein BDZ97DRAFT_1816376 [Flammula alnicola]|nr:hypothetical protein BDZ97DRAFT_1816376 [Flammula alnicola]